MTRLLLFTAALLLGGCGLARSAALDVFYDEADLPVENVRRDLAYLPDGLDKHRLDLFLPLADSVRQRPFPVLMFVHGGGWTEGDRAFEYGGEDLYGNVGRFFAARGIGTAVISYRLLPEAVWQDQVSDVAAALAWVQDQAPEWGGDPEAVAVMGHSAGGQLAARVALDEGARLQAGAGPVCAAVIASGAALDLTDAATWEAGAGFDYYAVRFSPSREPIEEAPAEPFDWQREASPATYATSGAPPFLLVTADGESDTFRLQAEALDRALRANNVPVEMDEMPALSHELGVPNLSRDDRVIGPAALDLVRRSCR